MLHRSDNGGCIATRFRSPVVYPKERPLLIRRHENRYDPNRRAFDSAKLSSLGQRVARM